MVVSLVRRVGLQDGSGEEMTDDGRRRYRGFPLVLILAPAAEHIFCHLKSIAGHWSANNLSPNGAN